MIFVYPKNELKPNFFGCLWRQISRFSFFRIEILVHRVNFPG